MEERDPKRSWWQTLSGILTAIGGLATAIAALVVAFNQAGLFQLSMTEALQRYEYEFGWSKYPLGSVDQDPYFVPLRKGQFTGTTFAVLPYYSRVGGGEVKVTIGDRRLTGIWSDAEGQGELEIVFDQSYARGVGWWNRGGQTQKYNAFMRRVK